MYENHHFIIIQGNAAFLYPSVMCLFPKGISPLLEKILHATAEAKLFQFVRAMATVLWE